MFPRRFQYNDGRSVHFFLSDKTKHNTCRFTNIVKSGNFWKLISVICATISDVLGQTYVRRCPISSNYYKDCQFFFVISRNLGIQRMYELSLHLLQCHLK